MEMPLDEEARALVERVAAIVPDLAAQAREGEQQRRVADAAWSAIEETGVFRMMVPRRYGGLELDLGVRTTASASAEVRYLATLDVE